MNDEQRNIILPDGMESHPDDGTVTERGRASSREDQQYVPVIVKRSDEVRRQPDDALEKAIEEGLEQLNLIGGCVFVGVLNYAHIRQTRMFLRIDHLLEVGLVDFVRL